MPAKSAAQFRAMQAAAHGQSTLGIPKSVGQEFVSKTAPGPSSIEIMTGLPSGRSAPKKTHRGSRGGAKRKLTVQEHHDNLNRAMRSGDHAGAKLHALQLANALHAATKAPKAPQSDDASPDSMSTMP